MNKWTIAKLAGLGLSLAATVVTAIVSDKESKEELKRLYEEDKKSKEN